jgi:hypothetical protein
VSELAHFAVALTTPKIAAPGGRGLTVSAATVAGALRGEGFGCLGVTKDAKLIAARADAAHKVTTELGFDHS